MEYLHLLGGLSTPTFLLMKGSTPQPAPQNAITSDTNQSTKAESAQLIDELIFSREFRWAGNRAALDFYAAPKRHAALDLTKLNFRNTR